MGISSLGDWFKKKLEDNASRAINQINPFDNGRTWQNSQPTNNRSVIGQAAHNGITNTVGNFIVKPFVLNPIQTTAEIGRMTAAGQTHNDAALQASIDRQKQNLRASIPGFITGQLWNAGDVLKNAPQAIMADVHGFQGKMPTPQEQQALTHGLHALDSTVVGQMVSPAQSAMNSFIPGAKEQSAAAGYDVNASGAKKYIADPVLGTAGTYGFLKGGAGALEKAPAVIDKATGSMTPLNEVGAVGKDVRPNATPSPQIPGPKVAPAKIPQGQKERGFVESVKNSPEVSPQVQAQIEGSYIPKNQKVRIAAAEGFAQKDLNGATDSVMRSLAKKPGTITDQEASNAISVAKAYDAMGTEAGHNIATDIYEKLAPHGTTSGQLSQAFADLRNRTPEGMKFKALRDLKKAGVKLTGEANKQLDGLIDEVRKTKANTPERDMAIHRMVTFVSKNIPNNAGEKAVNFWRAGLLTSPVTTAGNILGNTTEAATRNVWVRPVATASDAIFSLFTGKRTTAGVGGGQLAGVKEGLGKAGTYLKTGFDERNPITKFDQSREVNYGNGMMGKATNAYVNGVYRWMGGQDQPFYYAAKHQELVSEAIADAKNLGLKGAKQDAYVQKAITDPTWKPQTFKSKIDPTTQGKYGVYQNETLLGHIAGGAKTYATKHSGFGGAVANFILPFTQVPSSVAMRIIDRTPIGIAKEAVAEWKNHSFDQRAMSEAIGNGTFAPGVIAVGYALAKNGDITGNYPTDAKERELWRMQGKQANSVRVGNRWFSLNYMQPFGVLLGIGAQAHNDRKAGKSVEDVIGNATGTAAKSVEGQSFLQGVNGLLSAINDPNRSMNQYISTTASSTVPNFVRTGARATDPLQRDNKGIVQGVESAIPGLRETLPARQDAFGRNLPAFDNPINQFTNPWRPSIVRNGNDPVINELDRLMGTDNGIMPTQFDKSTFYHNGQGVKLNDQQVRDLQSQVGPQVYKAWSGIVQDPNYQALSDADKATVLKQAMDQVNSYGKNVFVATGGKSGGQPLAGISNDALNKANLDVAVQKFKNSGDKTMLLGDTYYFKTKDGSVKSMPKVEYDVNMAVSNLNLNMDRAQASNNLNGWMELAKQKYDALESKKSLYDPATERDKIDAITLQQENLMQQADKYSSYGGFKKGGNGKGLPNINVSIPSDLSGPVVSNASYSAPKYRLKNKGAPRVRTARAKVKINAPRKLKV